MRPILYALLSLATAATTFAAESTDFEEKLPDTIFNGQTVPPMKDLTGDTLDQDLSKGNWYAEPYDVNILFATMLTNALG